MELLADAEIIGLALYLKPEKTLVLADLHLGYEEEFNKKGVLLPRLNYDKIVLELEKIFKQVSPERIIINGDLKHEFGAISRQEWREVLGLLDFLEKHCDEIILVQGNHDTILGPIAEKKNVLLEKNGFYFEKRKLYITHGHRIPFAREFSEAETLVIGHEHPAVTLKKGVKREKYKCFMKGKWGDKEVIVLPSFNFVSEGTDLLKEDLLSPFIKQELESFDLWLVEDKEYFFGNIRNLMRE